MNTPETEAVASSWVPPNGVPGVMSAGLAQVIVGVVRLLLLTLISTVAVAELKSVVSVGVNVTASDRLAPHQDGSFGGIVGENARDGSRRVELRRAKVFQG